MSKETLERKKYLFCKLFISSSSSHSFPLSYSLPPPPPPPPHRALFSYDGSSDMDRPGEAVSFQQGDILHVLNGSDEEWWQAAVVGPSAEDGVQGLIPSKQR